MWLIIILLASVATADENDQDYEERNLRSSGTGVIDSFIKFKNDVANFFKVNYDRVELRRQKIKNAFFQFIHAALNGGSSKTAKCTASSLQFETLLDKNVHEEPQNQMNDFIKLHGYTAESHVVVTTDGYYLMVHRIVLDGVKSSTINNTQAVLLHHGIFGSSEDWVLLGSKKALPYILLNAGYDVWLANARGSKYSREHDSPNLSNDEYWNFSWHEMGQYDLPAVIEYIKDKYVNNVDLHFIGHSMGSTALLVLLSIYPRFNHMLKSATLLAPMAFMYKVKGPLRLLAEFYGHNENFRKYESLNFLKPYKSAPLDTLPVEVVKKYCQGDPTLCMNPLLLIANGGQDIPNDNLRETIQFHSPAGISVKTILHYIQLIKSGNFQMYNLGSSRNLKKYGTEYPPTYRLNDVTLPVAIFSSSDDWLATGPDIQSLLPHLQNLVLHHVVRRNDFSHTDFVWAEDADVLVYYLILDLLKDITSKSRH